MRRTINGEENRYARARACDPQRFKIRVCRLRHRYLGYNRRLSLSLSLFLPLARGARIDAEATDAKGWRAGQGARPLGSFSLGARAGD